MNFADFSTLDTAFAQETDDDNNNTEKMSVKYTLTSADTILH